MSSYDDSGCGGTARQVLLITLLIACCMWYNMFLLTSHGGLTLMDIPLNDLTC